MNCPALKVVPKSSYETCSVYPVSEDTELLIRCLSQEKPFIDRWICSRQPNLSIVLEVGTGSGAVMHALGCRFERDTPHSNAWTEPVYVATDVNHHAVLDSSLLFQTCGMNVDVIRGNLFQFLSTPMLKKLCGDGLAVVVFNPPYVETDEDELHKALTEHGIEASWAGGHRGIQVTMEFIEQLPHVMCINGVVYLLLLQVNEPDRINQEMIRRGFHPGEKIDEMSTGIERLSVWKYRFAGS